MLEDALDSDPYSRSTDKVIVVKTVPETGMLLLENRFSLVGSLTFVETTIVDVEGVLFEETSLVHDDDQLEARVTSVDTAKMLVDV